MRERLESNCLSPFLLSSIQDDENNWNWGPTKILGPIFPALPFSFRTLFWQINATKIHTIFVPHQNWHISISTIVTLAKSQKPEHPSISSIPKNAFTFCWRGLQFSLIALAPILAASRCFLPPPFLSPSLHNTFPILPLCRANFSAFTFHFGLSPIFKKQTLVSSPGANGQRWHCGRSGSGGENPSFFPLSLPSSPSSLGQVLLKHFCLLLPKVLLLPGPSSNQAHPFFPCVQAGPTNCSPSFLNPLHPIHKAHIHLGNGLPKLRRRE